MVLLQSNICGKQRIKKRKLLVEAKSTILGISIIIFQPDRLDIISAQHPTRKKAKHEFPHSRLLFEELPSILSGWFLRN
jgi:hypothetical protein